MFAILAAILFGVALLLDLVETGADLAVTLVLGGLLSLALHFCMANPYPWRRP